MQTVVRGHQLYLREINTELRVVLVLDPMVPVDE